MKRLLVSINNRAPYETQRKCDIENLFEQMIDINNGFCRRPEVSFTVVSVRTNKTVTVDWDYFDKLIPLASHDGYLWTNEMANLLLSDLT